MLQNRHLNGVYSISNIKLPCYKYKTRKFVENPDYYSFANNKLPVCELWGWRKLKWKSLRSSKGRNFP